MIDDYQKERTSFPEMHFIKVKERKGIFPDQSGLSFFLKGCLIHRLKPTAAAGFDI